MSTFNRQAASAYRNIGLETRTPQQDKHQLVALIYETFLEAVNAAIGAIERQDLPEKIKKINHALLLLRDGLEANLDMENGGELSKNLAGLYDYCCIALMQANLKNDTAKLQEVLGLIKPVADAWAQIRNQTTGGVASSSEGIGGRGTATMQGMYSFTVG